MTESCWQSSAVQGWHALRSFLKAAVPESAGLPGAVIAVQTFGDFPERFHPHCHVLCSDGCFYGRGGFRLAPKFHLRDLESLFRPEGAADAPGQGQDQP